MMTGSWQAEDIFECSRSLQQQQHPSLGQQPRAWWPHCVMCRAERVWTWGGVPVCRGPSSHPERGWSLLTPCVST